MNYYVIVSKRHFHLDGKGNEIWSFTCDTYWDFYYTVRYH